MKFPQIGSMATLVSPRFLPIGAIAILAMTLGQAVAAPPDLPGGPVYIQFNNLEQISTSNAIQTPSGNTEGNWGVFNVSTIQSGAVATPNKDISGGTPVFFDDGPGGTQGQVHGIFWGLQKLPDSECPQSPTAVLTLCGTSGYMDLYYSEPGSDTISSSDLSGDFSPANRTADNQAGKFTTGTFLARLRFSSGIVDGNTSINLRGTFDSSTLTGSGDADSFANVVDVNGDGTIDDADGVWAAKLNSNWFIVQDGPDAQAAGLTPETRDVRFSTFTNGLAKWNATGTDGSLVVGLRSNDPARAYTATDLIVQKTPDLTDQVVFKPGDTAYFQIKVTNVGATVASNVVLNDDLPTDNDTLSWAEAPDLAACSIDASQHLHCDVGDLAAGASFTVRIEATVPLVPTVVTASLAGTDFDAEDGNLLLDNSEIPSGVGAPSSDTEDWESFTTSIDCATKTGCALDLPSGSTDNSYTQGAKEDDQNPSTDFGSIPPSKDDLARWYYTEEFKNDDAYLYLAWIRNNQLGTATIDFELNQSSDVAANGVNPVRTEGDVLIVYDFLGGRVDEIGMLRWLTAAGGHTAAECEANNSLPCWGNKIELLASGLAVGAVNFYDNGTNKPGDDGYSVYDPIVGETIEKERFGEAAINLTQGLGGQPEDCETFAQAFVKSRASGSSFTSELKDFIAPVPVQISTCKTINNTALGSADNASVTSDQGAFYIVK
jgi:uncharacterized repeat protein (TIGR01451 family)